MIGHTVRLCLLDGFQLLVGNRPVALPVQAQRLLVLLALWPGRSRSALAGTLWGDVPEARAQAYLRNAIWRVRLASDAVLQCSRHSVGLDPAVALDLDAARRAARAVLDRRPAPGPDLIALLDRDLLPSWDEDWLVVERERQRQLRLHALEALSDALCRAGHYPDAIAAALAAVRAEPLRESAQRGLIVAHLAEGNVCEAVRQFDGYRRMLAVDLGIVPGRALAALVRDALQPAGGLGPPAYAAGR
jgi:DNA-binding SARP family transcriptional activator